VFSPDGARIATASADDTARIWDVATGVALATLSGHTGQVVSAKFSPDGSRLVTASIDRTARLWRLDQIVLMPADKRPGYICREGLIGAQAFSELEMQEPILQGREDLRHPCDRVGPLSPVFYWRAAEEAVAAIRTMLRN
jgi:hypothetical protein